MKLSEEQFWKRYFQSKLFNAHRASIRSSAAQHVVKDDPIFDKYLEKDDDGENLLKLHYVYFTHSKLELEPRRQRDEHVEVFVDLAATLEDHEEVEVCSFTRLTSFTLPFYEDWERERCHYASWKTKGCIASNQKVQ